MTAGPPTVRVESRVIRGHDSLRARDETRMSRGSLIQRGLRSLLPSRATWARWFALFVLVFAVPDSQHIVSEVVTFVSGDCADGCTDGCDASDCCPDACNHCSCCQPPGALALAPLAMPGIISQLAVPVASPEEIHPSGYSSPPFRPPTT